jgi:hypothetical protein
MRMRKLTGKAQSIPLISVGVELVKKQAVRPLDMSASAFNKCQTLFSHFGIVHQVSYLCFSGVP